MSILKAGCAVLAAELIVGGVLYCGAVAASSPTEAEYSAAIEAARAGDLEHSLPVIERKYRDNPAELQSAYNYILVLGWANRQADAIAIFETLPPGPRPGYVDAAAARDYRDTRQYEKALALYRAGRQSFPGDMTFVYGELLTLTDAGRAGEAADQAGTLLLARPADSDLLTTALYALGATDRYSETLAMAERILALEPQNRDAHRQQAFSLQRLGAFMLAYEFARASPDMFSAGELRRFESDSGAALVRWGALSSPDPSVRNTDSDRALAELDRQIAAFGAAGPDARAEWLTARFNRMVALSDRGRAVDVISQYEALRREGIEVPPYALAVAAGAYQTHREPENARRLYETVLAADPENFQARMGLFYSEIESEDYGAAFRTIDALVASQPETVQLRGAARPVPNPAWLRASLSAAMARYYAGDPADAQARVEKLLAVAPDDSNLRAALGTLLAARGKVRAADQQFAVAQQLSPADVSIEVSRADLAITRGDRESGALARDQLMLRDATNAAILRLDQRLQVLAKPELVLRFNSNFQSNEVPTGGNSLNVEGQVFSAPLAQSYRLYADYAYASAALPEGRVRDHHTAVGVEYLSRDFFANAEITQDFFGKTRTGARALIAWAPTDEWRFAGTVQVFSAGTPLRALKHDITANSIGIGATYSPSDRQVFNLAAQVLRFSDDNIRVTVDANGTQRLFTSPHLLVDVTADFYGSNNSLSDAPYYNPKSDFAASLTATVNHILFRRYSFVYSQRFGVTAGEYAEHGFTSGFAGSLFYEQRLKLSDDLSGGLGLRFRRQPYDGNSEDSLALYGDVDWRF